MIPDKKTRDEWRRLAADTMLVSAVGEYTPEEFTTLLDAVDALETENGQLRKLGGALSDSCRLIGTIGVEYEHPRAEKRVQAWDDFLNANPPSI